MPDETHHSDVNVLEFFGLRVLWVALKSLGAAVVHKSSSGVNIVRN